MREYFELHGFLVRQQRKHIARGSDEDEEIDFLVLNPQLQADDRVLPFVLNPSDLVRIPRAIVAVKGWHTETFSPARLIKEPDIMRFAEPRFLKSAMQFLGGAGPVMKILVLPTLPQTDELREQSIALLRSKGIDAAIPFGTILAELISAVEVNRNYQKSDLLQLIRILKKYDFFKESQLELFKPKRARAHK